MTILHRVRSALVLLLGCGFVAGTSYALPTTRPGPEAAVVVAANRFALSLIKGTVHGNSNLAISPYCTFTSLALLREGAAGKTHETLRKLLGLSGPADGDRAILRGLNDLLTGRNATGKNLICETAQALWLQHGLQVNKAFVTDIKAGFDAEERRGDFGGNREALSKEINHWVEQQTHGKIKDLCSPDFLVGLQSTLISTIYFHGHWIHPFEAGVTCDAEFTTASQKTVRVKMMHREAVSEYYHGEGVTLTAIPYYTNEPYEGVADFQMILILPDDRQGLSKLENSIDLPMLERWIGAGRPTQAQFLNDGKRRPAADAPDKELKGWEDSFPQKEVRLNLPRFSIQTRLLLRDAMKIARRGWHRGELIRLGADEEKPVMRFL